MKVALMPTWSSLDERAAAPLLPDVKRQRDAHRARFLGSMAHELRTPIAAMCTFLEVARRRLVAGRPVELELVEQVGAQLERLTRMVGRLSDTGRLEDGRPLPMRLVDVDLAAVVRAAIAARPQGQVVEAVVPEGAVPVVGDPDRLQQLVTSLLDNAFRYAPEGGPVRVRLARGEREHVVTVEDEGTGIAEADLPHVTERYFRGGNASDVHDAGVGLGLAIGLEIVERHEGRLEIDSRPGEGTRVTVALPAAGAR